MIIIVDIVDNILFKNVVRWLFIVKGWVDVVD